MGRIFPLTCIQYLGLWTLSFFLIAWVTAENCCGRAGWAVWGGVYPGKCLVGENYQEYCSSPWMDVWDCLRQLRHIMDSQRTRWVRTPSRRIFLPPVIVVQIPLPCYLETGTEKGFGPGWWRSTECNDGGCSEYFKLSYHKAMAYKELLLIPLKLLQVLQFTQRELNLV